MQVELHLHFTSFRLAVARLIQRRSINSRIQKAMHSPNREAPLESLQLID